MDIAIRGDVPISIHPGSLSPHAAALDKEGTVGQAAIAAGREALTTVYRIYASMQDAEKALYAAAPKAMIKARPDGRADYLGDLRWVGSQLRQFHGHEEEYYECAKKAFDRAALTVDRRTAELKKYSEGLAAKIALALDDPSRKSAEELFMATEIRNHVRAMKSPERLPFLMDAIKANDKRTLSAVLHAPAYLSGLPAEQHGLLRKHAAVAWAPVESAQLEAVEKVSNSVSNAGSALLGRLLKAEKFAKTPKAAAAKKLGELAEAK